MSFNPAATQAAEFLNQNRQAPTPSSIHGRGFESDEESSYIMMDRFGVDLALNIDISKPEEISPESYREVFNIPNTYKQAWYNECKFQRAKWRDAIQKEFKKMEDHGVWKIEQKNIMPQGKKCVKSRWVFDIKRNGIFRARLVACGYSQVPGQDFNEAYSPVVTDITVRILLVAKLVYKLITKLADIETAFLHGDLEEEIYMECPEGLDHKEGEVVRLIKTIYGLVQSAQEFYKKLQKVLMGIGFSQSLADPCLFMLKRNNEVVYITVWVDDLFCEGHKDLLEYSLSELAKHFKLKIEENTNDYLSCEIIENKEGTKAWVGQPHLIKKIENTFGNMIKGLPKYKTPGTPGLGIFKPISEESVIAPKDQTIYRSGVGMLLYLVKYSRPDIANAVQELAKGMQEPTPGAFKELKRVLKFVVDTKYKGLKLEPKFDEATNWNMTVYTDSDWASDKDSRRSVSGYVVFLMGCPIMWKSRQQKVISLSSSEAEIYACSDAAKEIKFVAQVLTTMGLNIKLPIIVRMDNVGAIFMAENVSVSQRTKHIDLRTKFLTQYIEEGFIKIIFVKSAENVSDGFTKNVTGEIYENHLNKFVEEKKMIEGDVK